MVLLISGSTHTGKTLLAQNLLEKHHYPYLSIDHVKMGLIRSGNTDLTPVSPHEELEGYLWPIVREIIKTAIENHQNLIVEGYYIPFNYRESFGEEYLTHIKATWLIFSENYINNHFDDILNFESVVEIRMPPSHLNKAQLKKENLKNLNACIKHGLQYILIDENYNVNFEI